MKLEILTPDKKLFDGEASSVIVPGTEGSMGILDFHAPMITTLKGGKIKVKTKSAGELTFEIRGGVLEVLKNSVVVLAE